MRRPYAYLAIVIAACLSACGDRSSSAPSTADIAGRYSSESPEVFTEATKRALVVFEQACPSFVENRRFFEAVGVKEGGEAVPRAYGWHNTITVNFRVKQRAELADFKPESEAMGYAPGHACQAVLGGGLQPGIELHKRPCASFCRAPEGQTFLPVAEMSILESAEASSAAEAKRVEAGAVATADLLAKALARDYQAQRNLAYGYATGTFGSPYKPVDGCAWYLTIVNSGSPKVDVTDKGNVRVYCGKLSPAQLEDAERLSTELLTKLQ